MVRTPIITFIVYFVRMNTVYIVLTVIASTLYSVFYVN